MQKGYRKLGASWKGEGRMSQGARQKRGVANLDGKVNLSRSGRGNVKFKIFQREGRKKGKKTEGRKKGKNGRKLMSMACCKN